VHGLGWVGFGEEGGWVRVKVAANVKVFFFLAVFPSCCTFLNGGGFLSFLSCWFPRGYRSVWVVGCAGSYLAGLDVQGCCIATFFSSKSSVRYRSSSFLLKPPVRTPL